MNKFLGKAEVSILSESLQFPPENEYVKEEYQRNRANGQTQVIVC